MAEIITFPSPQCTSLREAVSTDLSSDTLDALRDALARLAHEQPDAFAPILAVAFADATADLPKAMADRLARESAATLLPLLHKLRAFFLCPEAAPEAAIPITPAPPATPLSGFYRRRGLSGPQRCPLGPTAATPQPDLSDGGHVLNDLRRPACLVPSKDNRQRAAGIRSAEARRPRSANKRHISSVLRGPELSRDPPIVGSATCPFSRTPSPSVSLRVRRTSSGSGPPSSTPKASE